MVKTLQPPSDDNTDKPETPDSPDAAAAKDNQKDKADQPAPEAEASEAPEATEDSATKEEPAGGPYPDEKPDEDASTEFDDDKTSSAIDEIVAKEGDEVLAAQDAAAGKGGVKVKIKGGLWRHKWVRWAVLLLVVGGIGAAAGVPAARYFVLNTAGVRSSASIIITDSTTELPLKGVRVALDGAKETVTDKDGKANLKDLRLGPHTLSVKQTGFADVTKRVVIGWGSNPLGTTALKAVGIQYVIEVRDYLSDKPIQGAQAASGEATAVSDKNGKITLTLATTVVAKDSVTLTAAGYRDEQVTLNEDPKQATKLSLVMARKVAFITKETGRYDVYKSDIDGKNREVLLAGTGHETSNLTLVMSPDGKRAALVSTRANKLDGGGSVLSSLVLINVEDGSTVTIAESPQIRLLDWIGARLIFETVASDTSAANRYTVVGYNYADNTRVQLAAANKLYAAFSAQGAVYYAVGEDPDDSSVQVGLFKINPDGTGKQRSFEQEIWTVIRSDYNSLSLQLADGTWYLYNIPNGASKESTPLSLASRQFLDNADRTKSVSILQGSLLSYDVASGKDAKVSTPLSPVQPIQWLSADVVVYRVSSSGETADYAASILGGASHRISNVTGTYGFTE